MSLYRLILPVFLWLFSHMVYAAGMVTHLNMTKDALNQHLTNHELKSILQRFDRSLYTGTVYPDFDGSVRILPWRKSHGVFGQTHGTHFHNAYFDHLRNAYDLKTCYSRNDQDCMNAIASFMGILAHSVQDATWDILFVRKAFIKDYQTDDLWVGDLDTGGDVLMWDVGRGFGFSYTAPYNDLISVYSQLGLSVSEDYIGDGLRTHNLALEFEDEHFRFNNQSAKYHQHAPWFMANALSDPIGIPLYGEITAGVMEAAWQALISPDGFSSIEDPVLMQWPEHGAIQSADAYAVLITRKPINGSSLNPQTFYMTDPDGNKLDSGMRHAANYLSLLPRKDLIEGQVYTLHVTPEVKAHDGSALFPEGYQSHFIAGPAEGFWKDGFLFADRFPAGRPKESDQGPDYFQLKDKQSGLCIEIKDGVMARGVNIVANTCSDVDHQKWYILASETDGHTRGTRLASKKDDGYCIDLAGGNLSNSGNIHLWRCEKLNNNMYWAIKGSGVIASKLNQNFVMDVSASQPGANVHIWQYHGGNNQHFERVYDESFSARRVQLVDQNSGKCLTNVNSVAVINSCNPDDRYQQWWLQENGQIRSFANYLSCLSADGHTAGAGVSIQGCSRDVNNYQRWVQDNGSLQLRSNSRMVLDVFSFATEDHSPVKLWQDIDTINQKWKMIDVNGEHQSLKQSDKVCFYENDHYQGRSLCLAEGEYAELGPNWDDVFSGVEIFNNGLYVEAWQEKDFQGPSLKFMTNGRNFGSFKDRISSIKIRQRPSDDFICLYQGVDFSETPLCGFVGDNDDFLADQHLNDKFDSIIVSGNAEVVLYHDRNWQGGSYTIGNTMNLLPGGIRNAASSYRVKRKPQLGAYKELRFMDFCMDTSELAQNGSNVFVHSCWQPATWQKWAYETETGFIRNLANPQMCLDSTHGNTPGTSVIMWSCEDHINLKWDIVGNTIRPRKNHNLALDVKMGNPFNGQDLWLWSINDSAAQQFSWGQ